MTIMKKVINLYSVQNSQVIEISRKRHDYKDGGFREEIKTLTVNTEEIFALLDCGHVRSKYETKSILTAKSLNCFCCSNLAWTKRNLDKNKDEKKWQEFYEKAKEKIVANLKLAESHKKIGTIIR